MFLIVTRDDEKFVNTLIEESIIEIVSSIFIEKSDPNTQVRFIMNIYINYISVYILFNILNIV